MNFKRITIRQLPSVAKRINLKKPISRVPLPDMTTFTMGGPSDRTMKTEREYRKYRRSATFASCVFCDPAEIRSATQYRHFFVLPTKFKYEVWDDHMVKEHLLVVPKRHTKQILDFTEEERKEYLDLLARYENDGYSIYSRAPTDAARSVTHFHTHFLKLNKQTIHSMIYVNKPHIMLYRKRSDT